MSSPQLKRHKTSPSNDEIPEDTPEPHPETSSSSSWTEEDEIRLLTAVVEITGKRSDYPGESDSPFNQIESSLHGDYSWEQMVDKLKLLKRRYENRELEIPFQNSHARDLFEICEKIWGDDSGSRGAGTDAYRPKNMSETAGFGRDLVTFAGSEKGKVSEGEFSELGKKSPLLARELSGLLRFLGCKLELGFNSSRVFGFGAILRKGLDCLEESKLKELNEQWRLQEMREMELLYNRMELIRELTQLICEAIKPSKLKQ